MPSPSSVFYRIVCVLRCRGAKPLAQGIILLVAFVCGGCSSSTAPAPTTTFTFGPTSLTFPSTAVGTTSSFTAVATLSMLSGTTSGSLIGAAPLSISSITDSDNTDFPMTTTCPIGGSITIGADCSVSVQFHPHTVGPLSALLTVTTNGIQFNPSSTTNNGTATVTLLGTGN
jgi:hypothetical protein